MNDAVIIAQLQCPVWKRVDKTAKMGQNTVSLFSHFPILFP